MQDINVFYNEHLQPVVSSLDIERNNVKKKILLYLITPGVLIFLAALVFIINTGQLNFFFIVLFLFSIGFTFFYKRISRSYVEKFKTTVIQELVKFVDSNLNYNHNGYIREWIFRESRLYNHRIDDYKGEDYIHGLIGKTSIEFSEIIARYKTTTRTKNGTITHWHTLFDGLFFIADFNKDFNSDLIIKPDIAERIFGRFGQKLQKINVFQHGDLIKMENPDFEKIFKIHGTNQIEARYILTPGLMEKILELNNKIRHQDNSNISVSFIRSKIYIALPLNKNLFEPKIFGSEVINTRDIEDYYQYIKLMVDIVEDLDLNTRIWTKE